MKTLSLQTGSKAGFMHAVGLVVFIALCAGINSGVLASQQTDDWQKQRLLHPTTAQRAHEQQGSVFIYDGLSEQEVDQSMDQNFDRIDAMMFINVKKAKTDNKGSVLDDDTYATDDDGC
ncbi:MAG: hypothetical protein P8047_11300 [Gammaproteobacteria bacterium]